MSVFDQRNQKVRYQYNANGTINFGKAQNTIDVIAELKKLQNEIAKATKAGVLDEEISIDAEANIKKAINQSSKPEPDKKAVLEYLKETKTLLSNIALVAGLVNGISNAIEMVRKLF